MQPHFCGNSSLRPGQHLRLRNHWCLLHSRGSLAGSPLTRGRHQSFLQVWLQPESLCSWCVFTCGPPAPGPWLCLAGSHPPALRPSSDLRPCWGQRGLQVPGRAPPKCWPVSPSLCTLMPTTRTLCHRVRPLPSPRWPGDASLQALWHSTCQGQGEGHFYSLT